MPPTDTAMAPRFRTLRAGLGWCGLVACATATGATGATASSAGGGYGQPQKLAAPTRGRAREINSPEGQFGGTVALSANGALALIGAAQDDGGAGATWVYARIDGGWSAVQKLTAPAGRSGTAHTGGFGTSVALSATGNVAVIGGPGSDGPIPGAAWVFVRRGADWRYQQTVRPPATGPGAERGAGEFGSALALSRNAGTLLIGGPSDHAGVGAVWAFTHAKRGWTFQRKLTAPTRGGGARIGAGGFGSSLALASSGDLALIGAPADRPLGPTAGSVGAAWMFTRSGTTWTVEQKLTAPVNGPDQEIETDVSGGGFGSSVALPGSGSAALIGGEDDNSLAGAVWVFAGPAGALSERQKLTAPSSGPDQSQGDGSEFGTSLAVSADAQTALIGGPDDGFLTGDNVLVGAAWLFTSAGGSWTERQKLTAPTTGPDRELNDNGAGGQFGFSVALSQNASTAMIGGVDDNDPALGDPYPDNGGVGAVWTFGAG